MMSFVRVFAPAKVNIGLNVLSGRRDGYHDIEGIFQTVRLSDIIDVSVLPGKNEKNKCILECDSFNIPETNTFSLTYKAFCEFTGLDFGVKVSLVKKIPAGGGLGGGSSDAASFLNALCILSGIERTEKLAVNVAEKVGSDVFFFLLGGSLENETGCALVSGRGEIVKRIVPRNDLWFLLIFPDVHSSTKEAYGLLDNSYAEGNKISCPDFTELERLYRRPVCEWSFVNCFTPVLVQKYKIIADALKDIKDSGALWSEMSGSGATVFGVFESKRDALNAAARLESRWNLCVTA